MNIFYIFYACILLLFAANMICLSFEVCFVVRQLPILLTYGVLDNDHPAKYF